MSKYSNVKVISLDKIKNNKKYSDAVRDITYVLHNTPNYTTRHRKYWGIVTKGKEKNKLLEIKFSSEAEAVRIASQKNCDVVEITPSNKPNGE